MWWLPVEIKPLLELRSKSQKSRSTSPSSEEDEPGGLGEAAMRRPPVEMLVMGDEEDTSGELSEPRRCMATTWIIVAASTPGHTKQPETRTGDKNKKCG